MFLKWTARAFAVAAAAQLGTAMAQEDALLVPAPAGPAADAGAEAQDSGNEALPGGRGAAERRRDATESGRDALENPLEDRRDLGNRAASPDARRDDVPQAREARYGSSGSAESASPDAPRSAGLDDDTRSRYRWKNGEWWFLTKSGGWKYHRDGQWRDFDPDTYQPLQANVGAGSSLPPQRGEGQPSGLRGNGYRYESQPYTARRPAYPPQSDDRFGRQGYYDNGRGYGGPYDRGYNDGRFDNRQGYYGQPGYGQPGTGGYDARSGQFYGSDAGGRPYSMSRDQAAGAAAGSAIGGRVGGRTGSIIGGALGAGAAD